MSGSTNKPVNSKKGGRLLPLFFIFILVLFLTLPVLAQSQSEVGYLIIDHTKTPWGHRFYKTFTEVWKPPQGINGYVIIIKEEKPSFKQSWIVVTVGDNIYNKPVYAKLLKPTTSNFDMQRYTVSASKRVLKFLLSDFLRVKSLENQM